MIFVYPSVISENVKDHLYPAIAKTLEQFYLAHLLEAFGSGTIRVKSVYNPSKKVYGPLLLEYKNNDARKLLSEAVILNELEQLQEATAIPIRYSAFSDDVTMADNIISKHTDIPKRFTTGMSADQLHVLAADIQTALPEISLAISKITSLIVRVKDDIKTEFIPPKAPNKPTPRQQQDYDDEKERIAKSKKKAIGFANTLKDLLDTLKMVNDGARDTHRSVKMQLKEIDKTEDPFKKDKEDREKRKEKEEEERKKAKKAQIHGSYQITDPGGISLKPTMATVRVKIHYIGGPDDSEPEAHEVAIGSKVVPLRVHNFLKIQDAILDDYFTSRSFLWFKGKYRATVRLLFKFVEKVISKISGVNVDMAALIKDPVKRYILLSPQGFVNASSFKQNRSTPSFYNFTSASVVFLSDDMEYEGGENFFQNRQQLQSMFKAGWNTFVIMNDIEEKAYFISSLDGGALHILPYSYLFNALKMDKVYDSDEFKRRSRGFQVKSGGINTLASRLNRESALVNSVRNVLMG